MAQRLQVGNQRELVGIKGEIFFCRPLSHHGAKTEISVLWHGIH